MQVEQELLCGLALRCSNAIFVFKHKDSRTHTSTFFFQGMYNHMLSPSQLWRFVCFLFGSLSLTSGVSRAVSLKVKRPQLEANFHVHLSFSHLLVDRTYPVYPRYLQTCDLIIFQISILCSLISDNLIFQNLITLKLTALVHTNYRLFPITYKFTAHINCQAQTF